MANTVQQPNTQIPVANMPATPSTNQKFVSNTPTPKTGRNGLKLLLIVLLLILLLIGGVGATYFFLFSKSAGQGLDNNLPPSVNQNTNQQQGVSKATPIPTSTLTPTPTRIPLAQGPQTYKVGGLGSGVNISEVWFSTIDPGAGYQQIKVSLTDTGHKVTSVTAEVKTDKLDNSYPLTLSLGDGTSGDWTGQWTVKGDTYNNNFQVYLFIKDDASNTTPTIITIR